MARIVSLVMVSQYSNQPFRFPLLNDNHLPNLSCTSLHSAYFISPQGHTTVTSPATIAIANVKYSKCHQNDNLSSHLQHPSSRTSLANPPLHHQPHSLHQRPLRKQMLSSKLPPPLLLPKERPLPTLSHRLVSHPPLNKPPNERRRQYRLSPPTGEITAKVARTEERDRRDGACNRRTHW